MALTVRGLDDICRLCAIESETGVPIYSPEGDNVSLEQKIINCLHIEVSRNDLLPKKVCSTCNALLEELHQFTCRAANAQQTLNFLFDLQLRHLQEQELSMLQGVKVEGNLIKNELDDLAVHQAGLRVEQPEGVSDLSFSHLQMLGNEPSPCAPLLMFTSADQEKEKMADENIYQVDDLDNIKLVVLDEEPRQSHRRKMFQPKKTAERVGKQIEQEVQLLNNDGDTGEVQLVDQDIPMGDQDVQLIENTGIMERDVESDDRLDLSGMPIMSSGISSREADLMDQGLELNEDSRDIRCLIDSDVQDDFKPVDFDENELFEDLEEEEGSVRSVRTVTSGVSKARDWNIACDKCREVYPRRDDFDKHYRGVHGQEPAYTCSQCGKTIIKFSSFRSHCFRHDPKYPCLYCDKVFMLEGTLRVHVLSCHVTVRPFICEVCGKGYVTQYRLNLHQKQHDGQAKEFRCSQCNKVLQTRNGLQAHMAAHQLGRRFMCHLCGKTFTQKVNLQQHVKFHKGERPFPCDQCDKAFAEKSHLNRHKSFHTFERPFQCQVCQKMYKTERCLKVHNQVHQENRPFKCSECGKGFLNSTKLKQHFHCHTGERPYACKYCERSFTNYPNWLKHIRRRHNVDPKTGVRLKEEDSGGGSVGQCNIPPQPPLNHTDYMDLPDVKVKEDGIEIHPGLSGDSNESILTQFHVSSDLCQFQLQDSQLLQYTDHSHMLPL